MALHNSLAILWSLSVRALICLEYEAGVGAAMSLTIPWYNLKGGYICITQLYWLCDA